ncbi:SDR family NAD(P)-dependent oxidoreductase [Alteromonas lipotrueae]|uniref:SDR family NAD(P)-dependent oxidoreductase n=1 Tax=Alteromonas lipotrueae TaxID=2803814 RepID=UPI001C47B812|nr:SDR family NAD(P)-dependent oxidoreductase [Alteromonas lipotrueae]
MNILIAGGHTGIGLELTKILLEQGHKLGLVVRNQNRADALEKEIDTTDIDFFYADLSKHQDVVSVAEQVTTQWQTIDGLFNNAGVMLDDTYFSDSNNEMHYEVNVLAPYKLATLLAEKLEGGFIVNTATGGLHNQSILKVDTLLAPTKFVKLMGAYYQSKLALTLLINDFAKSHSNTLILNVDPGLLKTKMSGNKESMPLFMKPIVKLFFKPPADGAKKLLNAAFNEQFKDKSGVYITGNKVKRMKVELTNELKDKLLAAMK